MQRFTTFVQCFVVFIIQPIEYYFS